MTTKTTNEKMPGCTPGNNLNHQDPTTIQVETAPSTPKPMLTVDMWCPPQISVDAVCRQVYKHLAKTRALFRDPGGSVVEKRRLKEGGQTVIVVRPMTASGMVSFLSQQNIHFRALKEVRENGKNIQVEYEMVPSRQMAEILLESNQTRHLPSVRPSFYQFEDEAKTVVLLNCKNGVLRVTSESAELLPSSDDNYGFTERLLAAYAPEAECPMFNETLEAALPDREDQEALAWWGGYTLLPEIRFKAALVCKGDSDTRKSTLVDNGLGCVFPESARTSYDLSEICDDKGYELPSLVNAAVNIGGELDAGDIPNSHVFKTIAAGEPIHVRPIKQAPYHVTCYATKLVFLSNSQTRFKAGTDAEYNRLYFLSFGVKFTAKDETFRHRMAQQEKDGILSQVMVPGLQWVLASSCPPAGGVASRLLRETFRGRNDPLAAFIRQCCVEHANAFVPKTVLKEAYSAFLAEQDFSRKLIVGFGGRIRERGFADCKRGIRGEQVPCFGGLRLKEGVARVPVLPSEND
jgi:phage/plasmid-associated DNA primase